MTGRREGTAPALQRGMPASFRRGDTVSIRDERWTVRRHVAHANAAVIEVRGCGTTNRGVDARFVLPFEPVHPLPLVEATRVVTTRRWRHQARQALAEAVPAYDSLRSLAGAGIDLLPFQLEPALAVVRGAAARILIADEVGLGKTIQAGLIAAETLDRCADAHVLVVAPAALREQWCGELRDRFRLAPVVLDSATLSRSGSASQPAANPWAAHPLAVTSVDFVKRPETMRALETIVWDLVVVDEAHGLSGRSDRNAALTLLSERARTLVMLTATPHSGDEAAFARMCGVGDIEHAFPLLVFRRTRGDAGLRSARRTTWLNVRTSPAESALHLALSSYARLVWRQQGAASPAARLAMIVLMRRACSSAASLARSVERRISLLGAEGAPAEQLALPLAADGCDDDEPGAELGAPGLADAADERRRLEAILTLARDGERDERKLHAIRRLLRRTGEPAIVFTEYRDTLIPLAAALPGFTTAALHGGMSTAERRQVLERFRSGDVQVLLATDAASEGLNLQSRCRLVINLEVPWTPTRIEQRIGRVDRIGQRRRVHAVHLVGAGTAEETTVARLLRRTQRAQGVVGAMRAGVGTDEDVARCVIGEQGLVTADEPGGPPLPSGLIVANLRDEATVEATRASVARALAGGRREMIQGRRPFVARSRVRSPADFWVFRLELTGDNELIWEALVGISFDAGACTSHRSDDVRRHADRSRALLASTVSQVEHAWQAGITAALDRPTALAVLREQGILAAASDRHGRLAAALLQRGLFDRRVERTAAAHDAALDEMFRRCRARLASLIRRQRPAAAAAPAFGLVCR